MKLTWFGGDTLRLHIGGAMLVVGPALRPGVDRRELGSGADREIGWDGLMPVADPVAWQPRRPRSAIEAVEPEPVLIHRLGEGQVLVDAVGEPPLLLLRRPLKAAGRWARDAVVVAFSAEVAEVALRRLGPRLVALALPATEVDEAFAVLEAQRDGAGLVALEPGLALET